MNDDKSSVTLDFYIIEVLTRAEDGLENCSGADEMVWKWIKPESPYRKDGFWCGTAGEAIYDGVWNAGRGFRLLVENVGSMKKRTMCCNGGRSPAIMSDEHVQRYAYPVDQDGEMEGM
ncbi:hypothetical protein F5884DRAFT_753904 [Xylogone sp. PMI_703]|nr:hypothetical protein F5884DRAFT_753904 [Xylogone sp. PMI_703]